MLPRDEMDPVKTIPVRKWVRSMLLVLIVEGIKWTDYDIPRQMIFFFKTFQIPEEQMKRKLELPNALYGIQVHQHLLKTHIRCGKGTRNHITHDLESQRHGTKSY